MKKDDKNRLLLIKFLEKLNNGEKLTRNNIEQHYSDINAFIERLDSIDGFPFDTSDEDIYCFEMSKRKSFDKYHFQDIMKAILDYETNENYEIEIQNIIEKSKAPRREDEVYQIISSYEPYEFTHCIAYELAIRNDNVKSILDNIKSLTTHSKQLFETSLLQSDDWIRAVAKDDTKRLIDQLGTQITSLEIDFENFDAKQAYNEIMRPIAEYIVLLEEKYYMIYNREEIIPEGMEDIFKEPNHHEPDRELYRYMDKAIRDSIKDNHDSSPRYKDNYALEEGYAVYQASYEDSNQYDINKIYPNFKRPMREFNQTQVAFNISLPKKEILAYIEKIKDDYDSKKNNTYKTLEQLLCEDDTKTEYKSDIKASAKSADSFFIYDYFLHHKINNIDKADSQIKREIQMELTKFHGVRVPKNENEIKNKKDTKYKYITLEKYKKEDGYNENDDIFETLLEENKAISIRTIEDNYTLMKKYIQGEDPLYKTLLTK